MKRFLSLLGLALAFVSPVWAQTNPAANAAKQWRMQHERAIVDEYFSFLALPNIARDKADIHKNAETLAAMMQKRGIAAKLVSVPNANPVVFGEIATPGAARTIVFYAHYDGQPLDPKEWATPPFTPSLKKGGAASNGKDTIPLPPPGTPFDPESRIYARGAADDKAPILAILAALDAIKASGLALKSNIKFAFEGEEEAGSPNFERILAANKDLFKGDIWLSLDGPLHQSRRPLVVFGDRGIAIVNLTIYGAKNELHSGHYGNWAPNPAMMLARLVTSMKDDEGRVLVAGFYDGIEPLSDTERRAVADAPDVDAGLMREFALGGTENAPKHLAELILQPSLNIRGMAAARVGTGASNVIPASATASIDMRLVKGMDPHKTADKLIAHIKAQGYFVTETEPGEAMRRAHAKLVYVARGQEVRPHRTPMDTPLAAGVLTAIDSVRGAAIRFPSSGGTGPDAAGEVLGMPSLEIPIANHDDNQHSFDENLRVQNLWDGIELMAALLTM
jgi:acetylornithine deacetylase/succinyl-diaminopimelate desuccinylase-like protein